MGTWNTLSGIITVCSGCAVALLALGCIWPAEHPPRTRPDGPSHRRSELTWATAWNCSAPETPFTLTDAHTWMQLHRDHDCPRKRAAFDALVVTGHIHPDTTRHNRYRRRNADRTEP